MTYQPPAPRPRITAEQSNGWSTKSAIWIVVFVAVLFGIALFFEPTKLFGIDEDPWDALTPIEQEVLVSEWLFKNKNPTDEIQQLTEWVNEDNPAMNELRGGPFSASDFLPREGDRSWVRRNCGDHAKIKESIHPSDWKLDNNTRNMAHIDRYVRALSDWLCR